MVTDNNHPLTSFSWPFLITFGNKTERKRGRKREEQRESGSGVAYSRKNCLGRRKYGWKFERQRPAKLVSFEEKMSRARRERLHGRVGIEECRRERRTRIDIVLVYNGGQRSFDPQTGIRPRYIVINQLKLPVP